jgi:hypothetical protein
MLSKTSVLELFVYRIQIKDYISTNPNQERARIKIIRRKSYNFTQTKETVLLI